MYAMLTYANRLVCARQSFMLAMLYYAVQCTVLCCAVLCWALFMEHDGSHEARITILQRLLAASARPFSLLLCHSWVKFNKDFTYSSMNNRFYI